MTEIVAADPAMLVLLDSQKTVVGDIDAGIWLVPGDAQ